MEVINPVLSESICLPASPHDVPVSCESVRALLHDVENRLVDAKENLALTIEDRHILLLRNAEEQERLQKEISDLATTISDAEVRMGCLCGGVPKHGTLAHATWKARKDLVELQEEIDAYKLVLVVVSKLLKVQKLFDLFDLALEKREYDGAAAHLIACRTELGDMIAQGHFCEEDEPFEQPNSHSGDEDDPHSHCTEEPPEIIEYYLEEYLKRRALVIHELDELLGKMYVFGEGEVRVRPFVLLNEETSEEEDNQRVMVADVLHALEILGLLDSRLEILANCLDGKIVKHCVEQMRLCAGAFVECKDESRLVYTWRVSYTEQCDVETLPFAHNQKSTHNAKNIILDGKKQSLSAIPLRPTHLNLFQAEKGKGKVSNLTSNVFWRVDEILQSLISFVSTQVLSANWLRKFGSEFLWPCVCRRLLSEMPPAETFAAEFVYRSLESKAKICGLISADDSQLSDSFTRYKCLMRREWLCESLDTIRTHILSSSKAYCRILSDVGHSHPYLTGVRLVSYPPDSFLGTILTTEGSHPNSSTQEAMEGGCPTTEGKMKGTIASIFAPPVLCSPICLPLSPEEGYLPELMANSNLTLEECTVSETMLSLCVLIHKVLYRALEFKNRCREFRKDGECGSPSMESKELHESENGVGFEEILSRRTEYLYDDKVLGKNVFFEECRTLLRQCVSLFVIVRPTAHRIELVESTYVAALFQNDCALLLHQLLCVAHRFGRDLPEIFGPVHPFIDIVVPLRKVHFSFPLLHIQYLFQSRVVQRLNKVGAHLDSLEITSSYVSAETELGAVLSTCKEAFTVWESTLSRKILRENTSLLLSLVVQKLLCVLYEDEHDTLGLDGLEAIADLLKSFILSIEVFAPPEIFEANLVWEDEAWTPEWSEGEEEVDVETRTKPLVEIGNRKGRRVDSLASREKKQLELDEAPKVASWKLLKITANLVDRDLDTLFLNKETVLQNFSQKDLLAFLKINTHICNPENPNYPQFIIEKLLAS